MGDEADADWQEGLVEMGYELVADPDSISTAKKVRDLLFAEGRASFRCGIIKIPPFKDQDMRKDWFYGWRFEAGRSCR